MAVIISVFDLRFGTSSQHTLYSNNRPEEPHESQIALLRVRLIIYSRLAMYQLNGDSVYVCFIGGCGR